MKNIKIFCILIIFLLVLPLVLAADKKNNIVDVSPTDIFHIDYVYTPSQGLNSGKISIGNKTLQKGCEFQASQSISWIYKTHYIIVTNMRNGNRYKISECDYKDTNASSLLEYIRRKYIADKGSRLDIKQSINEHRKYLSRFTWSIINESVEIPVTLTLDDNHGFIIKSIPGSLEVVLDFDDETNEIIITTEMIQSMGIELKNLENFKFHLEYEHNGIKEPITDSFSLRYISNQ